MAKSSESRRRGGIRSSVALLTALGLSATAACTFDSSGRDAGGDAATSMTLATPYVISDLHPEASGFWAPEFGYGELLMRANPDGSIEPWLLESLEPVSPRKWLLTLRDGVTFQNGRELTAEMLSELLNRHLKRNEDLQAAVPGGEAVAVSELEVELTTDKPAGTVPSAFANEMMAPIFDFEAADDAGKDIQAQIEARYWTGPFVVSEITSETLHLEANDDYWGGEPALEEVTVRFIPDHQARVLAVQSGEADLALYPDPTSARALEGSDSATFITSAETRSSVRLMINLEDPAMEDARVRRAAALGLDYAELGDTVLPAVYAEGEGMYPAHLPFAVATNESDPDQAAALLEEAGWRSSNGVRERDGESLQLKLVVAEQSPDLQALALAIQDNLAALGIDMKIQEVPDLYDAVANDAHWSLALNMSNVFGADFIGDAQRYLRTGGRYNLGGISDPELDSLIESALTTVDQDAQADLLRDIQALVSEKAYTLFPAERRTSVVTSPEWEDYSVPADNLWVDADTGAPDS